MKKLLILSFLLYSLSGFSQSMVLINNTSEVIKVKELWTNDFCAYNFPGTTPYVDEAVNANQWVGPFSANTIYSYTGPFLVTSATHDFEYVELDIYDPSTMLFILGQSLGTDPTVIYDPASCSPAGPPTITPITWGPIFWPGPGGVGGVWSVGTGTPIGGITGIRQVRRQDLLGINPAPSFWTGGLLGGKIYRMTWFTVFNSITGKYDVEITIN